MDACSLSVAGTLRALADALDAMESLLPGLPPVEATVHDDYVSLFVFESRTGATFERRQQAVRALAVMLGASEPEAALLNGGRTEHYTAVDGRLSTLPGVSVTVFASRTLPTPGVAA